MQKTPTVLVLDDDVHLLNLFNKYFSSQYTIFTANSFETIRPRLISENISFDILLCDQGLGSENGLDVVTWFKEHSPQTIRMIASAYQNFDTLVRAINEGEIYRFVVKPWNWQELNQVFTLALESHRLIVRNKELSDKLFLMAEQINCGNDELAVTRSRMDHLLTVLYKIQRQSGIQAKLDLVVEGIVSSRSFRRAIIYRLDEELNVVTYRHAGLESDDIKKLKERGPLSASQIKSLLSDRYRLGNSYFIPAEDESISIESEDLILSHLNRELLYDWHPRDILIIPIYGINEMLVGIISVDDPFSGKRPTSKEMNLLELFAHEAGWIIEQEEVSYSMINAHRLMMSQNSELRNKKMVFHSLLALNYLTRKTVDIEKVIESFKDYFIALFNADSFHLLLHDRSSGFFQLHECFFHHNLKHKKSQGLPRLIESDDFVNRILAEKNPVYVKNSDKSPSLIAIFNGLNVETILTTPLIYNEENLGVLLLGFHHDNMLSCKALEDFELFSNQLSSILFQERLISRQDKIQRERYMSTIQALATAIEKKDPYTRNHCDMVREYSLKIANRCGLSEIQTHHLEMASILHDIGKIGISIDILRKKTPLTAQEYERIKEHPEIGEEILLSLPDFEKVRSIIRHHQERYDGKGYPDKLKGEEIPVEARILAVADAYDAMTSDRPYRQALSHQQARAELIRYSGIQWDPYFVQILLDVFEGEGVVFPQTSIPLAAMKS